MLLKLPQSLLVSRRIGDLRINATRHISVYWHKRLTRHSSKGLGIKIAPDIKQVRWFGIGDKLMNMATGQVEKGKEKQFAKMIDLMLNTDDWTLRPWRTTMQNQLDSWTMYIPGVSSSTEVKEMKNFKEMMDAMTDDEVDHPLEKLNGPARERISKTCGRNVDEVARLLFFYKQSLIIYKWLQEK
jgi:signal recognition particle GTPase